jgi:hypothetical protein
VRNYLYIISNCTVAKSQHDGPSDRMSSVIFAGSIGAVHCRRAGRAGEKPEGIDRLAEGEPEQSVGWHRRRWGRGLAPAMQDLIRRPEAFRSSTASLALRRNGSRKAVRSSRRFFRQRIVTTVTMVWSSIGIASAVPCTSLRVGDVRPAALRVICSSLREGSTPTISLTLVP